MQRLSMFAANTILLQSCLATSLPSYRKSAKTQDKWNRKMAERTEENLGEQVVSSKVALVTKGVRG